MGGPPAENVRLVEGGLDAVWAHAGASFDRDAIDDTLANKNVQTSLKRVDTSDNPWPELPAAAPPEDADYEAAGLAKPGWVISAPPHRGDGMADDWETFTLGLLPTTHRFHEFPDAPWLFRPQDDADGDGFTNIEEYANKTDPLMPTGEMEKSGGLPPSCLQAPLFLPSN